MNQQEKYSALSKRVDKLQEQFVKHINFTDDLAGKHNDLVAKHLALQKTVDAYLLEHARRVGAARKALEAADGKH